MNKILIINKIKKLINVKVSYSNGYIKKLKHWENCYFIDGKAAKKIVHLPRF